MWARLKPMPRLSLRARRGLRLGAREEREHVYTRRAAEVIAAHHLAKDPVYYRKLLRYVESKNPGSINAEKVFMERQAVHKLQEFARRTEGLELPYHVAKEALERMAVQLAHSRLRVVEGGQKRANPRHVLGGFSGVMPFAGKTEPRTIKGLRLGKNKWLLRIIGPFRVYEVDGLAVRQEWADFIAGGNPQAYKFVPKGEIWVDSGLKYHWDKVCIVWHEIYEALLMNYKGWSYMKAHHAANQAEQELRCRDRRTVRREQIIEVVLANLMEKFGPKPEKLMPLAEAIGTGLDKL